MNHGATERSSLVLEDIIVRFYIFLHLEEALSLLELILVFIFVQLRLFERGESFRTESTVNDVWLIADVGIENIRVLRVGLFGVLANLTLTLPFMVVVRALEGLPRRTVIGLYRAHFLMDRDFGLDLAN